MLVAGFCFATMGVFVKLGVEFFGFAELAFYRSVFTLAVVLALIVKVRSLPVGHHSG